MGSMLFITRGKKKGIAWDDMGQDVVDAAERKKCKRMEPDECFDKLQWDGETYRRFDKAMRDEGHGRVSQRGYEFHLCYGHNEEVPQCHKFLGYHPKTFRRSSRRR